MTGFSTPAIMLRRIVYGDYDLIITFFTLKLGKLAAIAKSAKKSSKRFPGILEPFSGLEIVCTGGGEKGLFFLKEAALEQPLPGIGADIVKTGYASYWAEIINNWMEERVENPEIYRLFQYVLTELEKGLVPGADLSILFQMRFLSIAGLGPNLSCCISCGTRMEGIGQNYFGFDLSRGGWTCGRCKPGTPNRIGLSRGAIKQLLWIGNMELEKAARVKFTPKIRQEGLALLEAFVAYHLGKALKSLKVLKQVRPSG